MSDVYRAPLDIFVYSGHVLRFCLLLCDVVRRLRTSATQFVRGLGGGRADERGGSVLRVALGKAQRDGKNALKCGIYAVFNETNAWAIPEHF